MNRIITLILALFASVNVFAAPRTAKINGKVENPIADSISISYVNDWIAYTMYTASAALSDDGTFSLSFPVPYDYLQVDINHGEQSTELFVQPGYDLYLTVNAANFDSTLYYKGKGAAVANFMAEHVRDHGLVANIFSKVQPFMIHSPKEYDSLINSAIAEEYQYMEKHNQNLPESFVNHWNNIYKYLGYYFRLIYPKFHEMMTQHTYNIKEIPDENFTVSNIVPKAFDDALLPMSQYRLFAQNYYETAASKKGETATPLQLAQKGMPSASFEYCLAFDRYIHIKSAPIDTSEKDISEFKKLFPSSTYLPLLEKKLAEKKRMSAGQPAIDLDLVTAEGKKMKLSDLKGKVVFMDFWASWCGPCMAEMPSSKEIREHFAGKDVVFLYISIDQDKENWKKAIEKYEIKGIHILQPEGWQAAAAVKYGINGIPAYFLIDRNGNFAIDTAPRPKEKDALIAEIEKLL